jgi:hypothetical protein
VPPFKGPVHITLRKALDYIRNMVILRGVHKPKDDAHSVITYNYPYQGLTEGRGIGLPTIHDELRKNGSPDAIIDADEEHTYFMICHTLSSGFCDD